MTKDVLVVWTADPTNSVSGRAFPPRIRDGSATNRIEIDAVLDDDSTGSVRQRSLNDCWITAVGERFVVATTGLDVVRYAGRTRT